MSNQNSKDTINKKFIDACREGNIINVKKLLTNPDLKQCADIHFNDDFGLRIAVSRKKLDIVKYLLTSPNLLEHADISANKNEAIIRAFISCHLPTIHFFLTNDKIKDKSSFIFQDKRIIRSVAGIGQSYSSLEIVKYLISSPYLQNHVDDKDLQKEDCTPDIWEWLKNYRSIKKELEQINACNVIKNQSKIL